DPSRFFPGPQFIIQIFGQGRAPQHSQKQQDPEASEIIDGLRCGYGKSSPSQETAKIPQGLRRGGSAKDHKTDSDKEKGVDPRPPEWNPPEIFSVPESLPGQQNREKQTPEQKIPGCPVPQSCEEPYNQKVPQPAQGSPPAAPQMDVHIVPKP